MTGESDTKKWNEYLGFTAPKYVENPVLKAVQRFYPISVGMMSKLRTVAKPIVKAMAILFGQGTEDQKRIDRAVTSDQTIKTLDKDGKPIELTGQDTEVIVDAISPELAVLRFTQRQDAIEDIFTGLLEDRNLEVLAEIIMDSMRDVFTKANGKPPPKEFIDETPLPALGDMIKGVVIANADVIGPVGGKLKAAAAKALEAATAKLNVAAGIGPDEKDENENKTKE